MIQMYWAGWEHAKFRFTDVSDCGWRLDGVKQVWVLWLGPIEISGYEVKRFGDD